MASISINRGIEEDSGYYFDPRLKTQDQLRFQNTDSLIIRNIINGLYSEEYPERSRISDIDTETITRGIHADLIGISREYQIRIPDPDSIIEYLQRYPDIIDILWKAARYSFISFGKNIEISLEVSTGDDSSDKVLALFIRMNEYPEDIIDQLDSVCEKFEQDLINCDGFILLTTDFQSPN